MSNVQYQIEGTTGIGILPDGTEFLFDADQIGKIAEKNWYKGYNDPEKKRWCYIVDRHGIKIHEYLLSCPEGMEVDHVNQNTFDNRSANLRVCTHQQNQCNQPLQRNNTSELLSSSWKVSGKDKNRPARYSSWLLSNFSGGSTGEKCRNGVHVW